MVSYTGMQEFWLLLSVLRYESLGRLGVINYLSTESEISMRNCFIAVSHKDWELPNSRIWLAAIDIKSGLDFPIKTGICTNYILWLKKLQTKMQKYWLFSSSNIYLWKCQKAWREKKSIADEQTLAKFYSAHRLSQAKCLLIQTSYIKRIKLFLFAK